MPRAKKVHTTLRWSAAAIAVMGLLAKPLLSADMANGSVALLDAPESCFLSEDGSCRPQSNWLCYAAGVIIPFANYCEADTPFCPS